MWGSEEEWKVGLSADAARQVCFTASFSQSPLRLTNSTRSCLGLSTGAFFPRAKFGCVNLGSKNLCPATLPLEGSQTRPIFRWHDEIRAWCCAGGVAAAYDRIPLSPALPIPLCCSN